MDHTESPPDLATLVATSPDGKDPADAMRLAALMIDLGGDAGDASAIARAETLLDQLQAQDALDGRSLCRSHYFRANIWSARRQLSGTGTSWTWRSAEIDNEILELRRALAHPGFPELHRLERAQVLTNLGNTLDHIGRYVEAIEAWDRALLLAPTMAMPNGNRGLGLSHYAAGLYDPGHNIVLALAAREAQPGLGRVTPPAPKERGRPDDWAASRVRLGRACWRDAHTHS